MDKVIYFSWGSEKRHLVILVNETSHFPLHHSIHQTVVWSTPWWYKPAKHWCWKTFSCKNLWLKLKPVFVAFGLLIVLFVLSSWLFCSDPDAAWPRGLSACLSHTVIDVQIQRLSKNVPHQRLSAVWAGYSSSPPLLLIYWWCLQNVAPLHVVGFPFLALLWRDAAVCWKSCCMRQAEEREKGKIRWEAKARTDVVRVWSNLNVLWQPVASSFLCISVSFRQTHCFALSVKPKAQQERNKREAHVKLNWHLITAAGS